MNLNSKSRDSIAFVFICVSLLFLVATFFKAKEHLTTKDQYEGLQVPVRSYTHHARQLTSADIDDAIEQNPSLTDLVRSLVEVELRREKHDESGKEGRSLAANSQLQEPITEEPGSLDIPDERQTLTDKTVFVHTYLYQHYLEKFDWFLKADDDTYVIMENLRFLLSHFDPAIPGYIGCQFKHFSPQGYMSGGAGYLFNREGLRRLVERGYNIPARCRHKGGAEDIETGRCAYKAGIRTLNSLDVYKKSTFFPSNVHASVMGLPDWARRYMRDKVPPGHDCCSQLPVAFHYTGPTLMYAIDFLLYRVSVHGRRFMAEKAEKLFDGTEVADMDRSLRRRPYPGEDLDQYYSEDWREQNTTIFINPKLQ